MSLSLVGLRVTGAVCAVLATGVGLVYLLVGGAPLRYASINLAALLIGLTLLAFLRPNKWSPRASGTTSLMIGILLLAVGIWGKSIHGAVRWVVVGGLVFEPSMLFLPFSILLYVRSRNLASTMGMILAATAMAIQPDRSMAAALMIGLLASLISDRDRSTLVSYLAAIASFAVTMFRVDTVPPAPFVERVFVSAFALSPAMGIVALSGAILLLLPAALGLLRCRSNTGTVLAFAGVWAGLIAASVLGNYPTPVVGYGTSAILGYLLSVTCLPPHTDEKYNTTAEDFEFVSS